jgi:class 3 adenylate cyclase
LDTETVTVVFTDLVDSTALASRVGSDAADVLARDHLRDLRDVVGRHGGDQVKTLGDGVMAVFSSPSAALDFAVAVQQHVAGAGRRGGRPLDMRIGVSAGEVRREDGDVFGDAVVEAARLCDRAAGGEILVSEVVRGIAGRRSSLAFEPAGDLELKGLPEPVPTLRLVWVAAARQPVPLPAPMAHRPDLGFAGRVGALDALAGGLAHAAGGNRAVVLVAGEPGIGKTAVTARFAQDSFDAGSTVLYGGCEEGLEIPYQPFIEALTHYVVNAPVELLAEHVEVHGGELTRLVPALARRVPGCPNPLTTEIDAERYLTFSAAAGLLALASRDEPVLVVVDDLHWADKPSLQLLRFLVDSTEPMRVCFVGTYRSSEVNRSHPLSPVLARFRTEAAKRIVLGGLDMAELLELMESIGGRHLDPTEMTFVEELHRYTDGNPFFLWEILRHLVEVGALYQDATGRWVLGPEPGDLAMPQTVREVVQRRVERLGEEAEHALSSAAVVGQQFDLELVAGLSSMTEDDLLTVMEAAVDAALVAEAPDTVGRFAFSHALVQRTLYDRMGQTRRQFTHRRLAEALETRYGEDATAHFGELAYHWAKDSDDAKALSYAARAGAAALRSLAPDEALRWYRQALELLGTAADDLLRCDLLVGLGTAQRQSGSPDYRDTLLQAGALARVAGDGARLTRVVLANSRGFWSAAGRVDHERLRDLEEALALTDAADSPERARMLAMLCSELTFSASFERRRMLADEAKAMAERVADPGTTIDVLNSVFSSLWVPATLDERLRDSERAVDVAGRLDDPAARFRSVAYRMRARTAAGHLELADLDLETMATLGDELGQPDMRWAVAYARACRALIAGAPERAEDLAGEAQRIGTACGQPDADTYYVSQLVSARWQQGRSDEVVPLIEEAARANPGIPGYWAGLARALCEADRAGEAAPLLEEATAQKFAHLPEDATWSSGMSMYADAAIALADPAAAGVLYELLEPWAGQLAYLGTISEGPLSHYVGALAEVLGLHDEADAHLGRSLEVGRRIGARFFVARTELEWGRALLGRPGREARDQARTLLESAAAGAGANGYRVVARRAEAALGAAERRA